mmetsp:Transcript_19625/g.48176  ORF Transcript_19625/g.48176 Transcript_19625/m.48176 type:complete len:276 (+) Transcript_19625:60-887(+)
MADAEPTEGEAPEPTVELTQEMLAGGLSGLGKTMDGTGVAMTQLSLPSMSLGTIVLLSSLANVRHIDISGNLVPDLEPLHGLGQLLSLNASGNRISSVALPRMEFLQLLDLSSNTIKGVFSGLDLPCLRHLKLSSNEIESVGGLEGSTQLQRLELDSNKLASCEGLKLDSIKILKLNSNAIVSLEGLPQSGALIKVEMGHNQVASFDEGVKGLIPSSVVELDLSENPLMEGLDRVKFVVEVGGLKVLNTTPVTDDERAAADLILNPPPAEEAPAE